MWNRAKVRRWGEVPPRAQAITIRCQAVPPMRNHVRRPERTWPTGCYIAVLMGLLRVHPAEVVAHTRGRPRRAQLPKRSRRVRAPRAECRLWKLLLVRRALPNAGHYSGKPSAEAARRCFQADPRGEQRYAVERCGRAGREGWRHAHSRAMVVETEPANLRDGHEDDAPQELAR